MRYILRILFFLSVLVTAIPGYAATDGAQLLAQIDRNLNPTSFESYRKIINTEPDGRKKEYTYYTMKRERQDRGTLSRPGERKRPEYAAARG